MTRRGYLGVLLFVLSVAAPARAALQSAPAPVDVSQGKKLLEGMCARCHGMEGTGDEGPSLNRPTLTRLVPRMEAGTGSSGAPSRAHSSSSA